MVLAMIFSGYDTKHIGNPSKNKLGGSYQVKQLYMAMESFETTKRQPAEWEKIFSNHIYNKGLIPETYKELLRLNDK